MTVSAHEPDWSRETPKRFWDPSRRLLAAVRGHQAEIRRGGVFGRLSAKLHALRHRFWTVVTQADIPLNSQIDGGLLLPHPNGVVVHPSARIGPNCLLFQQVTLGTRAGRKGAPVLEGHVDVGAGAKILGPVRIGRHAVVGANAVVLDDVPPGGVVVGVPGRVVAIRPIDKRDADLDRLSG